VEKSDLWEIGFRLGTIFI